MQLRTGCMFAKVSLPYMTCYSGSQSKRALQSKRHTVRLLGCMSNWPTLCPGLFLTSSWKEQEYTRSICTTGPLTDSSVSTWGCVHLGHFSCQEDRRGRGHHVSPKSSLVRLVEKLKPPAHISWVVSFTNRALWTWTPPLPQATQCARCSHLSQQRPGGPRQPSAVVPSVARSLPWLWKSHLCPYPRGTPTQCVHPAPEKRLRHVAYLT